MPVSKNLPCTILTSALSARRFLWAAALVPDVLWSLIRPLPPSFNAETARWSTTCIRPSLPHGYSVRTPKWHFLGDATETIGLRFWNDLLAAFTRIATTQPRRCRCSLPFRRCKAPVVGRALAPIAYWGMVYDAEQSSQEVNEASRLVLLIVLVVT